MEGNSKEFCHSYKLNAAIYFFLCTLYDLLKAYLFLALPVLYEPSPQDYSLRKYNLTKEL